MTTQTNLDLIWASTGGVTDPGDTKYATGWVSEIPTYQNFNFVLQNNSKNHLVLAEDGHFTWQNNISYKAGTTVILSGKRYYCRVDNTNQNPSTDTLGNYWIQGNLVGDALPSVAIMDKGHLIKSPAPSVAASWNSNTQTLEHAQPVISLVGDNASHKNWLFANVAGTPVLVDVGTTTAPDNRNIAIGQAGTKKIYHEGNKPTQADVSGTIPEANLNGTLYGRKDGAWAAVPITTATDSVEGVSRFATPGEHIAATLLNVSTNPAGVKAYVDSLSIDSGMAVGTVVAVAANAVPGGYILCDGASYSRATFPDLFAVIGTTYGSTSGTTFNVPDLRGEFIRGLDNGRGVDAARTIGSAQSDEFKSHVHTAPSIINTQTPGPLGGAGGASDSGITTDAAGGTETRPRNVAMIYVIKAFGSIVTSGVADITAAYSILTPTTTEKLCHVDIAGQKVGNNAAHDVSVSFYVAATDRQVIQVHDNQREAPLLMTGSGAWSADAGNAVAVAVSHYDGNPENSTARFISSFDLSGYDYDSLSTGTLRISGTTYNYFENAPTLIEGSPTWDFTTDGVEVLQLSLITSKGNTYLYVTAGWEDTGGGVFRLKVTFRFQQANLGDSNNRGGYYYLIKHEPVELLR